MSARSSLGISLVALLAAGCSGGCSKSSGAGSGAQGDQSPEANDEPLRVAAASDLQEAFGEIGPAFEKESGHKIVMSFQSTGLLAKQLAEGAPYDVFAAANVSFVDDVVKSGACDGATKRPYAQGHLVVWAKDEATLPKALADLKDAKYARIAIANPEHAPYGKAAKQALTKAEVWATTEPRVVYGENVQQALQFARSGNADVAIVGLSAAMSAGGKWLPVDLGLHEPLVQAMVVCKGGAKPKEGRAFEDFVSSEAGRAIMKKHGFLMPGEPVTN